MTHDAELMRLCLEFDALHIEWLSYFEDGANYIVDEDERETVTEPISERLRIHLDRICGIKATTPAGIIFRARTLARWDENYPSYSSSPYWLERMLGAILRDALEVQV